MLLTLTNSLLRLAKGMGNEVDEYGWGRGTKEREVGKVSITKILYCAKISIRKFYNSAWARSDLEESCSQGELESFLACFI